MTLKQRRTFRSLYGSAALLMLASSAYGQSGISSSISGRVLDVDGTSINNAIVTIVHVPTGKVYTVETDAAGNYASSGLRPGGPYTLYVRSAEHTGVSKKDIEVAVNQDLNVNFSLEKSEEEIFELEALEVVASGLADYGTGSVGPSLVIHADEVMAAPSVERSINDLARLNPFIISRTDASYGDFQISAAGKNYRYNKIMIDGVQADDPFGLQANGIPARGNLITKDAIESLSTDIANYDAQYSGYTGALINAVTKSGTNEFHGSVYSYYRNDSFVGTEDRENDREIGEFKELTYGATFGGPILKDKLFFFVAYEKVENKTSAPVAKVKLTEEQQSIIQAVAEKAGIADQIGSLNPPGTNKQQDEKFLAKLDWNISQNQRASFRYQKTEGEDPVYYDYDSSSTTSYSSHWATQKRSYESFVGQLFSDWSDDFSTETSVSYASYDSTFGNLSSLPRIVIGGVGENGKSKVELGCEEYRQANTLGTDTWNYDFRSTYRGWLNHKLSAGLSYERTAIYNLYFPWSIGEYDYNSLEDLANNKSSFYRLDYTLPGQDAAADFTTSSIGAYVQDEWDLAPNLVFTMGLRVDTPVMDDKPAYNSQFESDFGTSNANVPDGKSVIQPRASLAWTTLENRMRVRLGAGLFYGKVPPVWISNSYSNTGTAVASLRESNKSVDFSPTPKVPDSGTVPTSRINYMDEDFEMPSDWRYTLAGEYDTGFWDLQAVGEVLYTRVNKSVAYYNDNLNVAYTMSDGRPIYGPSDSKKASSLRYTKSNYYDVIRLANSNEGESLNVAVGFRRLKQQDGISLSAFYIYGDSKDVNAGTSSQATSNYFYSTHLDANANALATSNYEVKNRVLVILSKELKWAEGYETNVSLIFDGHSGRPFSWVFNNDVNNEGSTADNDLFYVPSGKDDPLYGGMKDPATEQAFFDFIESHDSLRKAKGGVVKRNSDRDPFQRRFDLSISQNVKIWENVKSQFFLNVINVANLINKDWGAVYESDYPQVRAVASASIVNPYTDDAKYLYTFDGYNESLKTRESRWQIQLGAKISF